MYYSLFNVLVITLFLSKCSPNPNRVKPRSMHGSCEILINELHLETNGFIEIGKVCPSNLRLQNQRTDLNGFVLILMSLNGRNMSFTQVNILDSVNLIASKIKVPSVQFHPERKPSNPFSKTSQKRKNNDSRARSQSPLLQATLENQRQENAEYFLTVQIKKDLVITAVILLHLNAQERRRSLPFKENEIVTDQMFSQMQALIHDSIVILNTHDNLDHRLKLLGQNKQKLIPLVRPEGDDYVQNFGFSKCDTTLELSNALAFKYAKISPASPNYCNPNVHFMIKETPFQPPYGPFKGKEIGLQALELTINLVKSLEHYKGDPKMFTTESKKLAAKLINIGLRTIYRAENRLIETGSLARTAKRIPFSKIISEINDDVRSTLYETITSFYKQNLVPTLKPMYDRFMSHIARDNVTGSNGNSSELFKCGFGTFRKILKLEDYKYGRINHRDAVLFNPDKVAWRGRYLKRIRQNDADQRTADTHAVIDKSWVRSCYASFSERRDFALANFKPGKGRRLIIVAAGNENGFINGSIFVKKISKTETTEDFHDNINADSFRKWFMNLLDILDRLYTKKFLIVMDNAPSHSEVVIRSGANKKEMIAWISMQKERGFPVDDGFQSMRNWQLKDIIKSLKKQAPHYKLDDYARERGHEIVRIPPFQCELNPIEEVWKDIKHSLKKDNVDQNINNQFERAKQILQDYDKTKWAAHVRHIKRLENDYWINDGIFDEFLTQNPDIEAVVTNGQVVDIEGDIEDTNQLMSDAFEEEEFSCDGNEEEC